jgi:tetratricopeptide (TPR) repeat protein
MQLYYLLAQSARARDLGRSTYFIRALDWCSRAELIAAALLDYGAQVDLHELRGTLHRAVSLYWIAAEEFSYAVHLLREHAEDRQSFDPDFEITLAAKAAAMEYLLGLGALPRALEHMQQAIALLPLARASVAGQGTVEWTLALLYHQRNELAEALRHVEVATSLYRQLGTLNSTCRVLSLAADIALDLAESAHGEDGVDRVDGVDGEAHASREDYLMQASNYIEEALRVGLAAHDAEGSALARLSRARLTSVRGASAESSAPEADIREVLRQARQMHDDSLMTAAQTALGNNLLAQKKTEMGKRWLAKAVATATGANAPGLAFRAQRSLRRAVGRNV